MDSDGFFGPDAVEFAGNGRYLLDVDGQGQKSYTRATTIAKTLETTFHLNQWQQKNAAKGVAMRPDLVARAIVTPVDNKPAWKEILTQADVVAAGGAKANLGTAFHELHDNVSGMSDEEYAAVPAGIRDLYEKYRAELDRLGIVELVSEVTVCAQQIGTAGKADGFVRMPDGSVRVLDRKSGRVTDYPHAPAVQLAIYANADKVLMPSEGGPKWLDMTEVFATIDRETALIVDVTYATETTPASVHIYELDIMAGWYGALLACKVRRWRNRKDLLTPYQPEQMPSELARAEVAGAGTPPAVVPNGLRLTTPPQDAEHYHPRPVDTTGTHPAWSSAQQAVIQVNPDGSPAAQTAAVAVGEQLQKVAGFTYEQIQNGEHKDAAKKAAALAEAALQAAADRQEATLADQHAADSAAMEQPTGMVPTAALLDEDALLKLFKDKASLQAAARKVDPAMKVNRTRANLAADIVSHPQWAARRGEFIPMGSVPPPASANVAGVPAQQYPNAGLPQPDGTVVPVAQPATVAEMVAEEIPIPPDNPFAEQSPADRAVVAHAPKSPEELILERIAQAAVKNDLAVIWQHCRDSNMEWSARLQQAAATKMSSFTN